jgi:hypothetical protein
MLLQPVIPKFGVNYDTGYIGFTYTGGFVAGSVAYFERWNRSTGLKVSHTFVVSGDNECIEAHINEGVARVPLTKYFADPACQVFFRCPRGWNPELGRRIADDAAAKLGAHYNTGLIVADVAADTFMGHWLNRLLRSWPSRVMSRACDRSGHWICSQLVAYALAQQPELQGHGVLRFPFDIIDPQELFEDEDLFEPWPISPPPNAEL